MLELHALLLGFVVALGVGLLIGIDRERKKGEGPGRGAAGLRTFTLASLAGATGAAAGGDLLLATVVLGMVVFAGLSYWHARDNDPGLTTETALVGTTLLGGLAMREPAFAAGVGVVVAVLLNAREVLHQFVRSVLTDEEIHDLLLFAGATLVVLPLLPDHPIGPYGALNLRTIWLVVILVMGVGALGYVAVRIVGPRFGLPLAGLASGFISSSATIAAMGARATRDPHLMKPAAAGAMMSSVATAVQLGILIAVTDLATFRALLLPLVLSGAAAIVYGGTFSLWALRADSGTVEETPGSAFSLRTALTFAGILAGVLLLAAALQDWFGEAGVILAAGAAGFADTHAPAISVASLVADGRLEPHAAAIPILAAFSTNTVTKMVFAFTTGGARFALYVVPGQLLMLAAAWAAMLVV
ncbi:MAG: MgtC/SapB family protein [Reyranella sp.]|nr:MgtC/SapB family protein [Reyranella sp.]